MTPAELVHHLLEQLRHLFIAERRHARENTRYPGFVDLVERAKEHARRIRPNDDIRSTNDHLVTLFGSRLSGRALIVGRADFRSSFDLPHSARSVYRARPTPEPRLDQRRGSRVLEFPRARSGRPASIRRLH